MPQRSHTRRRAAPRPGGSSAGWPQREQKLIGFGRGPSIEGDDRSIRVKAVTHGDQNTEASPPLALR
jgi:hypothetical protein